MFKVKFNKQQSSVCNTAFSVGLILVGLFIVLLPAYAGPQSLLDPYADVQPTNSKSDAKSITKRAVKQSARQSDLGQANTAENDSEISGQRKNIKAAKTNLSKDNNAGFLSGVKEIQHGYVTSIKAAGGGIISGSKTAGTKVAGGTRAIGGGIAVASNKIISGPKDLVTKRTAKAKTKKPTQLANAGALSENPNFPSLPGRPLDQVVAQEKERKRLKDVSVTEQNKKPSRISSAVDKLNFFHKKAKKSPSANMTANNPNAVTH